MKHMNASSLTRAIKKSVKASTLISPPWETWRKLATSVASNERLVTWRPYRSRDPEPRCRKRLLQDRKLDLKRCIDICWTSERATTHPQALVGKHEVVNRVDRRANDLSKKIRKRGDRTQPSFEEKNTEPRKLKWKFCPQSHALKKELCLAWGERYNVCRKMNHRKGSEVWPWKRKYAQ